MRALIWNAHWATLGGGEVYAAHLAQVFQRNGLAVTLLGIHESPIADLESRLGIKLIGMQYVRLRSESDLKQLVRADDFFINASFGSELPALSQNSIYVCHFPTRKSKMRILGALDRVGRLTVMDEHSMPIQFHGGFGLLIGSGTVRTSQLNGLELVCLSGSVDIQNKKGESHRLDKGEGLSLARGTQNFHVRTASDSISVLKAISRTKSNSLISAVLERKFIQKSFASTYSEIWANSRFTQLHVLKRWRLTSRVVYPPCTFTQNPTIDRNPYEILSIGRFMSPINGHSKNQIHLIEAFGKLLACTNKPWILNLIGGVDESNRDYFEKVKELAKDYRGQVNLFPNCDLTTKQRLISEATFFWHAGGLGIPHNHPEKMEHFGIALIEAMNAGLIPVAFNAAGPAEVLDNHPNLLFKDTSDLAERTLLISNLASSDMQLMRDSLIKESEKYSIKSFDLSVSNQLRTLMKFQG